MAAKPFFCKIRWVRLCESGGTDACVRVAVRMRARVKVAEGKSHTYRLPESLYHGIIYHRKKG